MPQVHANEQVKLFYRLAAALEHAVDDVATQLAAEGLTREAEQLRLGGARQVVEVTSTMMQVRCPPCAACSAVSAVAPARGCDHDPWAHR